MKTIILLSLTGIMFGMVAAVNYPPSQDAHHPGYGHGHTHSSSYPGQHYPDPRSLDDLHTAALAEGGRLIVYAGALGEAAATKSAFESRFPGMNIQIIADSSKNHDARIQLQLDTNTLIPDVVTFRALHAFTRWRDAGHLLPYKVIGWDQIYPEFRDPSGYSTGVRISALSNLLNTRLLGEEESTWPTEFGDYLRPEFRGRIVSTWPNDEDAVLFQYSVIISKFGWDWLARFVRNSPVFVRSTRAPTELVGNGSFPATFTTAGALVPETGSSVRFILPRKDPFVSWAPRGAIFKSTRRPDAAKLYMSWLLDPETQVRSLQWSVRRDVPVPRGFRSIFDYPGQTDPVGFDRFMENRTAVEILRGQVQLFVGEVVGENPGGELGLHPKTMRPTTV